MKKRNHKNDISGFARYIRGEMTKREENAFQRMLQKDPFADEATEGFSQISPEDAEADISKLQRRLDHRISGSRRMVFYRIAASVAILMIISSVFIIINRDRQVRTLSETATVQAPPDIKKDSENEKREQIVARDEVVAAEPVLSPEEPSPAPPAVSFRRSALAEVRGTIISSDDNLPIPGAAVNVKGSDNTVMTDSKGQFRLSLNDTVEHVLVANFIGMETQELPVSRDTDMKISMTTSVTALSEVVMVGYGKAAKAAEAGAAAANEYAAGEYVPAKPVTGNNEFDKYIQENIQNPSTLPAGQRAVVIVSFIVKSTGLTENVKIIRSPGPEFSDEAIRLIREGPAWQPAEENGKPVDGEIRIRIVFK